MRIIKLLFLNAFLFLINNAEAQTTLSKTILHKGLTREYRLYIPAVYNSSTAVPLILNLHGYSSNNVQQEGYGNFKPIADTANFIIAHPNGTYDGSGNRFWNTFDSGSPVDDIGFLSALIDTVSAAYNIDANAVYSTGMSNGGFMSYDLACKLENKIAAIASVTGTMIYTHKNSCAPSRPVPVMQIHGTADATVPYNGDSYFVHIDTLVKFWVKLNNCSLTPVQTAVPNTSTTDNSTADHFVYSGGDKGSSVELFKVYDGGHSWPGAAINLNTTNMDFSASKEIWRFFKQYKLNNLVNGIEDEKKSESRVLIYPNPFTNTLTIENNKKIKELFVYSILGEKIYSFIPNEKQVKLNCVKWSNGVYLIKVETEDGISDLKVVK